MSSSSTTWQRVRLVFLSLLFMVGVGIMAYPFVSNAIYQRRADKELELLMETVDEGDHDAYVAERADALDYNAELVGQTVPDVFAIREGTTDEEYEGFLNVMGDQMMGSIEIPVIDVNLPIYHYSTEETLLKGCGHIFGSSLPVGGESTHAVITAHRGLPAAKLFTDLDQLQEGDRFYLHVLDQTLAYEVDNIEVVAPTETRSLAIQIGEDLVTLVTCTPYGVNTDRLLVRGHRVEYVEAEEDAPVARHPSQFGRAALQIGLVLVGVAAALALRALLRRRSDKGDDQGTSDAPVAQASPRLLDLPDLSATPGVSSVPDAQATTLLDDLPDLGDTTNVITTGRKGGHFRTSADDVPIVPDSPDVPEPPRRGRHFRGQ